LLFDVSVGFYLFDGALVDPFVVRKADFYYGGDL
jgi:hypothetical protein